MCVFLPTSTCQEILPEIGLAGSNLRKERETARRYKCKREEARVTVSADDSLHISQTNSNQMRGSAGDGVPG